MELLNTLMQMKAQLDEISATLDRLIAEQRPAREGYGYAPRAFETTYNVNTDFAFFKGKKPTGITLPDGTRKNVSTWKQLVTELLRDCVSDERKKAVLLELRGRIAGRNRTLLAATDENMRSPVKLCNYLYVESHYDTETLLHVVLKKILDPAGYDYSRVTVALKND